MKTILLLVVAALAVFLFATIPAVEHLLRFTDKHPWDTSWDGVQKVTYVYVSVVHWAFIILPFLFLGVALMIRPVPSYRGFHEMSYAPLPNWQPAHAQVTPAPRATRFLRDGEPRTHKGRNVTVVTLPQAPRPPKP